jgi:hypothetical protein
MGGDIMIYTRQVLPSNRQIFHCLDDTVFNVVECQFADDTDEKPGIFSSGLMVRNEEGIGHKHRYSTAAVICSEGVCWVLGGFVHVFQVAFTLYRTKYQVDPICTHKTLKCPSPTLLISLKIYFFRAVKMPPYFLFRLPSV